MGDGAAESRTFDDALRIAREALERADREARERAVEIVRRAEEEARSIVANAERQAEERAAEIVKSAEERARLVPVPDRERLSALLAEVQEASGLLQGVRERVEAVLRAGGADSSVSAPSVPVAPVDGSRGTDVPTLPTQVSSAVEAPGSVDVTVPAPLVTGSPETVAEAMEPAPPLENPAEPAPATEGAAPAAESGETESPKPTRPGAQTIVRGLRAQWVDGQLVPVEEPPEEPRPEPKRGGWPFR